jgi:zinc-ribbon domain
MALVACRECGKSISDKAATCPHCGIQLSAHTRSAPEERRASPWALWTLGISALCLFVIVVASLSQDQKPAMERLKEACAREFPGNSYLANDCAIRNAIGIIADDRQQKLDRARSAVR